jgi:hypothetical protein
LDTVGDRICPSQASRVSLLQPCSPSILFSRNAKQSLAPLLQQVTHAAVLFWAFLSSTLSNKQHHQHDCQPQLRRSAQQGSVALAVRPSRKADALSPPGPEAVPQRGATIAANFTDLQHSGALICIVVHPHNLFFNCAPHLLSACASSPPPPSCFLFALLFVPSIHFPRTLTAFLPSGHHSCGGNEEFEGTF